MRSYEGSITRMRGARGFSLVEVMVATVILTVGLLAIAQLMMVATAQNYLSGRITSSAAIAKERLERLKASPFYTDVENRTINGDLKPGGSTTADVSGYVEYYDSEGKLLPGSEGALFKVRLRVDVVNDPKRGGTRLPLATVRITVRCLAASDGSRQLVVGDATFVTYRTANVG